MKALTIILGNKNYSSWSLRAWLALNATGAFFSEEVIPLYQPDSRARLLAHGPSGKVPVLKHGDLVVWDSLAICEYLAELFPDAGLWPDDPDQRALARSISAEMHSGFSALRNDMPMDMRASFSDHVSGPGVADDIGRITEIWNYCRAGRTGDGPFLFGAFSIADAMYAPVASRFRTYNVDLDSLSGDYVDAIHAWPPMVAWFDAATREPFTINSYMNPDAEKDS